jgi:hypothetical protein
MHEFAHGPRFFGWDRLLAVLLGVVLWLPVLGPKLAQPVQAAVTCADAGGSPVGEIEADQAPSEAREGEDGEGEDSESSTVDSQLFGSRLRVSPAGSIHVGVGEYERERLSAAHAVLPRERGPPVV